MHVLIAIVGILVTAGIWYWRLRTTYMAAREVSGMARNVLGAARSLGFRRRANTHPVDSVDDPGLAVTAIGIAFLELDDLPSREDREVLAASVVRNTGTPAAKVEEMMIVGRWLVSECQGPQPAITRLTRRLTRLDPQGFQSLLPVLNDVGRTGGGLSARQRESLSEIAGLMKLR